MVHRKLVRPALLVRPTIPCSTAHHTLQSLFLARDEGKAADHYGRVSPRGLKNVWIL